MDKKDPDEKRPLNLRALDPQGEPEHFEHLVQRVRRAATPELVRRQREAETAGAIGLGGAAERLRGRRRDRGWGLAREPGVWGLIAHWRRALLLASGVLAVASLLVLLLVKPESTSRSSWTEGLGIPQKVTQWIESGEQPGPGDLISANGGE
jgi:hypothetical protein